MPIAHSHQSKHQTGGTHEIDIFLLDPVADDRRCGQREEVETGKSSLPNSK
jgi:hypothetical protein